MDLLEFGMENENSRSAVKRAMAQIALKAVKTKADMYEHYLESCPMSIPEVDTDIMLQNIREGIAGQAK